MLKRFRDSVLHGLLPAMRWSEGKLPSVWRMLVDSSERTKRHIKPIISHILAQGTKSSPGGPGAEKKKQRQRGSENSIATISHWNGAALLPNNAGLATRQRSSAASGDSNLVCAVVAWTRAADLAAAQPFANAASIVVQLKSWPAPAFADQSGLAPNQLRSSTLR